MAELAHRGGNVDQARQLFGKARTLDQNYIPAVLGLARLEDREGRLAEAASLYGQAARLQPNNATVLNDFALCLARQSRGPDSYRLLRTAVNLDPHKALYRNNMATVLIEMNRLDEALANLNAVHEPAVAQYNMGALLQQRGRLAESSRYLATALAIEPRMEPARILLARARTPGAAMQAEGQRSILQTARTSPAPQTIAGIARTAAGSHATATATDDSILPTPEEKVTGTSGSYPVTSMPSDFAMPAADPGMGDNGVAEPTLLPPVQ